jgi:hypothetical protein
MKTPVYFKAPFLNRGDTARLPAVLFSKKKNIEAIEEADKRAIMNLIG